LDLEGGELVQWRLLSRSELRLVRRPTTRTRRKTKN
jgi:hypothetical protein